MVGTAFTTMARIAAVACLAGLAVTPCQAQYNICQSANGTAYRSTSPCPPVTPSSPTLVYRGPVDNGSSQQSYTPSIGKAGEELRYMSAECASMQEAIRTAPARGIGASTQSELRRNFNEKCSEERSRATRQLYEEKSEKRRQADSERQAEQKQTVAAQNAEKQRFAHCAEMRKSINDRKAKPNPTEGERNDLARFEERYQERCR